MTAHCGACGRPEDDHIAVLSRHATSEGEIVYTRCLCGSVGVRLLARRRPPGGTLLAQGPPSRRVARVLRAVAGAGGR